MFFCNDEEKDDFFSQHLGDADMGISKWDPELVQGLFANTVDVICEYQMAGFASKFTKKVSESLEIKNVYEAQTATLDMNRWNNDSQIFTGLDFCNTTTVRPTLYLNKHICFWGEFPLKLTPSLINTALLVCALFYNSANSGNRLDLTSPHTEANIWKK